MTIAQAIKAQVCQQSCNYGIIWNSVSREFTRIVTLRNILELIVSLCDVMTNADSKETSVVVKQAIEAYLEKHVVSAARSDENADQSFRSQQSLDEDK